MLACKWTGIRLPQFTGQILMGNNIICRIFVGFVGFVVGHIDTHNSGMNPSNKHKAVFGI